MRVKQEAVFFAFLCFGITLRKLDVIPPPGFKKIVTISRKQPIA